MKKLFTLLTITCSFFGYAQTTTFDKNLEQATTNERLGESKMVETMFKSETAISSDRIASIAAYMSEKDGYVSITVSNNIIIVKHENWMAAKDIQDLLKVAGVMATQAGIYEGQIDKE